METENVCSPDSGYLSCSEYSCPSSVASSSFNSSQDEESIQQKRDKNKRNSRVYNQKKKLKEKDLKELLARKTMKVLNETKKNEASEAFLKEVYMYVKEVYEDPQLHFNANEYIDEQAYEQAQYEIAAEYSQQKRSDVRFAKYKNEFLLKKEKFEKAAADLTLKAESSNTYGSRKSRSLHSMNIAKYQFEIAQKEYELLKLKAWSKLLKKIHDQFVKFIKTKNTKVVEYFSLEQDEKERLDELIDYFHGLSLQRS